MKRLSFPILALALALCMSCGNQNDADKFNGSGSDTAMTDGMDSAGQTADRTRALPPDTSNRNIGRDSGISSPDTSRNRP
jgi:hypothetical protein